MLRRSCWNDYACRLPPAVFSLPPLPNSFLGVCIHTLSSAFLKIFLELTISGIFSAEISNKSATKRFAAGATFLGKIGIAVLTVTCARAPKRLPRCRPKPLYYGNCTCLEATILCHVFPSK